MDEEVKPTEGAPEEMPAAEPTEETTEEVA
jgi:hypothetical protein